MMFNLVDRSGVLVRRRTSRLRNASAASPTATCPSRSHRSRPGAPRTSRCWRPHARSRCPSPTSRNARCATSCNTRRRWGPPQGRIAARPAPPPRQRFDADTPARVLAIGALSANRGLQAMMRDLAAWAGAHWRAASPRTARLPVGRRVAGRDRRARARALTTTGRSRHASTPWRADQSSSRGLVRYAGRRSTTTSTRRGQRSRRPGDSTRGGGLPLPTGAGARAAA